MADSSLSTAPVVPAASADRAAAVSGRSGGSASPISTSSVAGVSGGAPGVVRTSATAGAGAGSYEPHVAGSSTPQLDDEDAGTHPVPSSDAGMPVACTHNAYVSNSGSDSVSVIDTTTHRVVATVATDKAPVNPTFTRDRRHVYVANSQAGTISIIDVETHTATTIPAGGPAPSGLAFLPGGQKLVVTLLGDSVTTPGSVTIITLASGEIATPIGLGAQPERIALSPDGARAYVSNLGDGTMSVVDLAAGSVIATLMLGDLPFNPLMRPDGKLLYVGALLSNKLLTIDPLTLETLKSFDVDTPNGMTFSLDLQSLYVSNAFAGTVQQISLDTGMVLKSGMVGGLPGHLALLPDGQHLYMVRPDGMTVEVLDANTLSIAQTITVESGPSTVAVCREP